ncbi:(Fe-S)-binding protein, partial [Candidatus Desantisbacteria bacterium]|nr:(Fe-S)-binding protein [Candidatus Desantisbacteria bacterium]
MNELRNLKSIKDEIIRCNRCGLCRSVCPVFKETGRESMVARGRMEIIESISNNKLDFSLPVSEILDSCLLCGACHENCPAGAKADTIVRIARCDRVEKNGLSIIQEFIFRYVLKNRSFFRLTINTAYYFQKFFMRVSSQEHVRHLPFFMLGLDKKRLLPKIAKKRLS